MVRSAFFPLIAALILASCDRDAPVEPVAVEPSTASEPESPPVAAPAEAAAVESGAAASVDDIPFDAKAFAGRFAGTLPCMNCPPVGATLTLAPDGTFALETRDKAGGSTESTGTWTVESSDTRLRLDPDSKREEDRLFVIVSDEVLQAVQDDGTPFADGSGTRLKRTAER